MGYDGSLCVVVILLCWSLLLVGTYQSETSQTGVLLQLRKHLEYPAQLKNWRDYEGVGDPCNLSSSLHVTIKCHGSFVTELRILGDKHSKVSSSFNGYAIPNKTLSAHFSVDSFITTLTKLSKLKVLSLVSLGIWGLLPYKIHRLYSLEVLDLSSNFLYGSIPPTLSNLVKLESLTLDGNFFNDTNLGCLKPLLKLTSLSIKHNRLKGRFPSSITVMKALTDISMSDNVLHGKLPDFSTLTSLRVLNLMNNSLDSDLPALPKGLVTVLLGKNHFSGKIPQQFGKLNHLQHLNLSFNFLSGIPPSALFSLPNISYLNLASNRLKGLLPNNLTCGKDLGFVDISSNKLTGSLPSCLELDSKDRFVNIGGNCFAIDRKRHEHHRAYCEKSDERKTLSMQKKVVILVGLVAGAIIVLTVLVFGTLTLLRVYHSRVKSQRHTFPKVVQEHMVVGMTAQVLASARFISEAASLGTEGSPVYRPFTLEELQEATSNFDHSMYLGEGCIGKIFKGKLKNGSHVAIRFLSFLKKDPIQNLKLKLDMLSRLQHQHLVGLLGHCIDDAVQDASCFHEIFLIYEYIPNRNFHAHLSESSSMKVLKWADRLAVLIGVAKAVNYLHAGVIPGVFGNYLKTHNILLDEHLFAKLSDYGMSIFMEETGVDEAKDKRSASWQIGLRDDVYNFGLILLETLVGPIMADKGEAFLLNEMASFGSQDGKLRIVDPVVLTTASDESLSTVISITNKCISPDSSTRPSFEDVLWHLQYAAQVQATADADQKPDTITES